MRRRRPRNFRICDDALFAKEWERRFPPVNLLTFKDIYVNGQGVLFRNRWTVARELAVHEVYGCARKARLALENSGRIVSKIEQALWMCDEWSGGFFHWPVDALQKLFLAREACAGMLLLLPSYFSSCRYISESLRVLGWPHRFMGPEDLVKVETLVYCTSVAPSGNYHEPAMRGMRDFFRTQMLSGRAEPSARRLYISRKKAQKRRVFNDSQLEAVLRERGFEIVCFEDYSWEEQVRMAGFADVIVTIHGAALTNALYMHEGASVVELRRDGEAHDNCYFSLASCLGLNYWYLTGRCEPSIMPYGDIWIRPTDLAAVLDEVLRGAS